MIEGLICHWKFSSACGASLMLSDGLWFLTDCVWKAGLVLLVFAVQIFKGLPLIVLGFSIMKSLDVNWLGSHGSWPNAGPMSSFLCFLPGDACGGVLGILFFFF
ncbi:hypothetical protein Dimus_012782 [Dionaea muscipula]